MAQVAPLQAAYLTGTLALFFGYTIRDWITMDRARGPIGCDCIPQKMAVSAFLVSTPANAWYRRSIPLFWGD